MTVKRILKIGSCNACPHSGAYGKSIYNIVKEEPCYKLNRDLTVNQFGYISIPKDCPLPKVGKRKKK